MSRVLVAAASPEYRRWHELFSALHAALRAAQDQRELRDEDTVLGPDGLPELEWMAHERNVMHTVVNEFRKQWGLAPLELAVVHRAEVSAGGLSDYTKQFAMNLCDAALADAQQAA